MEIKEQLEKKLKALVKISDSLVSNETFVAGFRLVLEVVEKIKTLMTAAIDNFNSNSNTFFQKVERELNYRLNEQEQKIDVKLASIKNGLDGRDGLDADETRVTENASKMVISEVLKQIPTIETIEADLPKLGGSIASALELLPESDKLKLEAIQGLKEELEELKKLRTQRLGGGGYSKMAADMHDVDAETPTGTINGVNKDFTLANIPNPTASLKVYRGGARQKLTEDYTLSSKTISFIVAPVAGEIIICDYQI